MTMTMMVDLNESEGHGDQAETEVGHGEIGDEHVPKNNNKYSQPIIGWLTQEKNAHNKYRIVQNNKKNDLSDRNYFIIMSPISKFEK